MSEDLLPGVLVDLALLHEGSERIPAVVRLKVDTEEGLAAGHVVILEVRVPDVVVPVSVNEVLGTGLVVHPGFDILSDPRVDRDDSHAGLRFRGDDLDITFL